jgi:hypothetical protein
MDWTNNSKERPKSSKLILFRIIGSHFYVGFKAEDDIYFPISGGFQFSKKEVTHWVYIEEPKRGI